MLSGSEEVVGVDLLIGVEGPENDGDDKSDFLVVESGSMGVFVDLVVVLDIIEVGGDCGGLVCLSGSLVALEVVELVSESIVEEAFWDEALSEGCVSAYLKTFHCRVYDTSPEGVCQPGAVLLV